MEKEIDLEKKLKTAKKSTKKKFYRYMKKFCFDGKQPLSLKPLEKKNFFARVRRNARVVELAHEASYRFLGQNAKEPSVKELDINIEIIYDLIQKLKTLSKDIQKNLDLNIKLIEKMNNQVQDSELLLKDAIKKALTLKTMFNFF